MKKVIYLLALTCMMSCADVTQSYYGSKHQRKTLVKFGKKRNYSNAGERYVPSRKRGNYRHPAVTKDTYKRLKQF